jgi:hypothetical protein
MKILFGKIENITPRGKKIEIDGWLSDDKDIKSILTQIANNVEPKLFEKWVKEITNNFVEWKDLH